MGMISTAVGRKKARFKGKLPSKAVAKEYAHAPEGKKLPEKAKERSF